MYGFQLIVNGKKSPNLNNVLQYENIEYRNFMIEKFRLDKCFCDTGDMLIVLDGVVLNKAELQIKYPANDWSLTLQQMYVALGETFFSQLRGSFAGAVYDKKQDRLIVFTDHLGSRFIYYAYDKESDLFCCSEMMGAMYHLLCEQGIKYHLSSYATKAMLTYGFMIEDYTLCEQIKKIEPGSYLAIKDKKIEIKKYYILDNTPSTEKLSEEEVLDNVDRLFRQAVRRQFEKDREYGYNHLCALSGGLDCRMTSFVAHDLGFKNQLNCTFSQSDYIDQLVPQQMAADLMHEWIFKSLDNGLWLYDVDEVTNTTGGNVLYYGIAHGNSLLKYINLENLGLVHSGQLGDVVLSSITNIMDKDDDYKLGNGAYSHKYLDSLAITPTMKGMNKEIGYYYYRFLNGTNNGLQNVYNYTETLSPFMDLDFLEYCLHLPVQMRQNHRLYKKWILKKYPLAAKYVWEKIGCRIDAKTISIAGRDIYIAKLPQMIIRKFGFTSKSINTKKHMNPIGYYLCNNSDLKDFLYKYFRYIDYIDDKEIKQIMKGIVENGTAIEKIQLVSVLAAIKLFF